MSRKEPKKYGAMFTCLACMPVHTEITNSTETNLFIPVLRRFIARCGNVRSITSGNGKNFVGVDNELKKDLMRLIINKFSISWQLLVQTG